MRPDVQYERELRKKYKLQEIEVPCMRCGKVVKVEVEPGTRGIRKICYTCKGTMQHYDPSLWVLDGNRRAHTS